MINRIEKVDPVFEVNKDCGKPILKDEVKSSLNKGLFQKFLNEATEKEKSKKNDIKDDKENCSSPLSNDINLMSLQQAYFSSSIVKKDDEKKESNNKFDSAAKAYGL